MSTSHETIDHLDAELANVCATLLKMVLTSAQAHAAHDGQRSLAERLGQLTEARLVVHALAHDLQIELLAPSAEGDTVRLFALTANSAPAWKLN